MLKVTFVYCIACLDEAIKGNCNHLLSALEKNVTEERDVVHLYEVHEDELAEDGGDAEESQPVADVQDGVFQ